MRFKSFLIEEVLTDWKSYLSSNSMIFNAVKILEKIESKGYEAFIVGGAVRDLVMGIIPHDIDIATNCPINVLSTIWKTHEIGKSKDFGIITINQGNENYEIAQYRSDGKYIDGRKPESVEIVGSFQEDASRRDFRFNAMAIDKDGNIIDYFDGHKDIKNKVLKTVGDPRKRFGEDYLRIMRAARFSAKLGFIIEPKTKEAAKELSSHVLKLSPERIRDEIFKAAEQPGEKFAQYLIELDDMGILELILPEITKLKELEHNTEHHPEGPYIWDHLLAALKVNKLNDPLINLAILCHDVGKGITQEWKNGSPVYYAHAEEGVKLIEAIADRLKLSNTERDTLIFTTLNHMKFHKILEMKPSKILKLVNDNNWDILVAVGMADERSRGEVFKYSGEVESIIDRALSIKNKYGIKGVEKTLRLVSGKHIMDITGLKPGPKIGEIITKVEDWIVNNDIDPKNTEMINDYIKSL